MFEFPSFGGAEVDVRSFPLSYQHEKFGQVQPDVNALCDLPSCRSTSRDNIKRLACFHTFHDTCISPTGPCPICRPPLEKRVEELSQSFNKGLLKDSSEHDSSEDSSDDDLDVDAEQHVPNPSSNTSNYYTSQAWETSVINATNAYHTVKQPSNANRVQALLQPAHRPAQTSQDQLSDQTTESRPSSQVLISDLPTLNISIPVTIHHHFSSWHFPRNLSQSSIQGRSGSNACTLIALTISKLFYTFPVQSIDPALPLNSTLAYLTVSGMLMGNQHYDRVTQGIPQYFSVREGVTCLSYLGSVTVGSELPVSIVDENVPTASLHHHLDHSLNSCSTSKTALLFILGGITVVFIPLTNNELLLVDSHLHGYTGALVAHCKRAHILQLLTWFKEFNSFHHTLGTVTKVTFN